MNRYQTQWAAQFAVASELCKRGYDVAFTVGNQTPDADIIAIGPDSHQPIMIDVKGQSTPNFWRIREKQAKPNLYYVLALVRLGKETQFFILSESEVRQEQELYKNSGVKFDPKHAGFNWGASKKYAENCWSRLPR
ncbi:MAG: hypothetical protein NVV72_16550 [Asticcacaulis sp.]|nr:hypothetical protein [Asticcacaulis sp.]